ncbi:putative inorganic phosphate cotransporter isoform X3 [Ostrinia furnacalis]|uniref:putative inorganic phosphate cotransporter isoform X3 n=1 Tax=Ostrinia furnacalis TaxID=93504 RepID=UPI00103D9017|nr:putative inorganic phosphate cotransporter isoform X3 [Ostrinia furnacalis]
MLWKLTTRVTRTAVHQCCGWRVRAAPALGVRHLQVLLIFFGLLLAYAMRVNMSMAIVAMTDPHSKHAFNWSTQTQSIILSSFFWGYIVLQVPAGVMANRIGGKSLLAAAVGINSLLVLIIPYCALHGSWKLLCACRVLQGLTQGVVFPSVHNMLGKWVPVAEKSRLGTFAYAGSSLGTALQLMFSGFIAEYWGWPMIFHSVGVLGVVWTGFYVCLGSSSPQDSRVISEEEREYIVRSLGESDKKYDTPWTSLLRSVPFVALIVVHCGYNWGFWTLMTEMPSYMKKVLGVDIKSNGMLSALPYLAMYLLSLPFGVMVDYVIRKNWLSLSAARKVSNSIGYYGAATALIVLCYVPPSITAAATLFTIAVALNVGHLTGFLLVHIDMAPNFAGAMMGITNFLANIISIVAPLVAGAILKDDTDQNEWRVVFRLSAVVYFVTNTIFIIYGTSERQRWNDPDEELLGYRAVKNEKIKS